MNPSLIHPLRFWLQEYEDLVKYLLMVRKKVKEPKVDSELIYAYAKTGQLGEIEEFIATPNAANLQNVGDKCFDEGLYEAAKILFTHISNWQRLASTLIKLKQFQVRTREGGLLAPWVRNTWTVFWMVIVGPKLSAC